MDFKNLARHAMLYHWWRQTTT